MKPLPRENTIWEFLRARIFIIFDSFITVSSRINILSIFYRILSALGLHFGTLGTTFGGHFFRSQKMQKLFLVSAPELRPSSTPPGEGGNWEAPGRHLGDIHRRFSPPTLPTSKKAFYNIWPSVEPRKKKIVDLTLETPWETPWDHPGSTFTSRPQKTFFLK